ncbi:MAG: NAD-dependent epimerase/dehydratase family protein [Gemmatimonadaceae bacterium]
MNDWSSAFAKRRAVVLGASGFIGRWTARLLADCGATVLAVGRDRGAVQEALGDAAAHVEIIARDSANAMVNTWLPALEPDVVFNLIGYGVDRTERDSALARRLNYELVAELTECVASLGSTSWPHVRLVHAGSALEYGTTGGVLHEDSATAVTTLYGETKLAGTTALVQRARASGTRALVARLFTVYGPGEHAGRLLPSVLAAKASDVPVPLSDGMQQRDFAYVEDVAEGLLRLALSAAEAGTIVNLASGVMQSVRDFVATAAAVCGIPPERLRFGVLPRREEEMQQSGVSVHRLLSLTGWRPPESIARGVQRALTRQGLNSDSSR